MSIQAAREIVEYSLQGLVVDLVDDFRNGKFTFGEMVMAVSEAGLFPTLEKDLYDARDFQDDE